MENTHLVTSRKAVAVLLIFFKKKNNNIELIVGCKLIKITTENLWKFFYASSTTYKIKHKLLTKDDTG